MPKNRQLSNNDVDKKTSLLKGMNNEISKADNLNLNKKDLLVLNELLANPNATSTDISRKLKIPLSTVQRRRATLEHSSVIRKSYEIDVIRFG